MTTFNTLAQEPLFGLATPNDCFRTSDWQPALLGPDCTIMTAPTNGSFEIFGGPLGMGSHAQSGRATDGSKQPNEFGAWIDNHHLFRDGLKRIYGECNTADITFDLHYFYIQTATTKSPVRYLIVPPRPIVLADWSGREYRLSGVEAGIALMALAWLETLDQFGKTGLALEWIYGPAAKQYAGDVRNDFAMAAMQFSAGAALLD